MREDFRQFMLQEGPPDLCVHGIPENIDCPTCIDDRWRNDYQRLENELENAEDTINFLQRLLEALHGTGWEKLTIFEARKIRTLSATCPSTKTQAHNEQELLHKLVEAAGVEPCTGDDEKQDE